MPPAGSNRPFNGRLGQILLQPGVLFQSQRFCISGQERCHVIASCALCVLGNRTGSSEKCFFRHGIIAQDAGEYEKNCCAENNPDRSPPDSHSFKIKPSSLIVNTAGQVDKNRDIP